VEGRRPDVREPRLSRFAEQQECSAMDSESRSDL
jgi:hypothetical protein